MTFGTMAIAGVIFLCAAGPVIDNQRALAANLAGSGLADPDPGIKSSVIANVILVPYSKAITISKSR
jgi:hypothetical protein